MASVTIEGLADLDKALAEFKTSTAKGILRRAGAEALQVFDDAWRANAPHLTGALQESGAVGTKLSHRQRQLAEQERESFVEVFVGPGPNPQAIQEEFGNVHQAAHPFARPAWDATKDQVLARVKGTLAAELDKTARRVAARAAARAAKNAAGV